MHLSHGTTGISKEALGALTADDQSPAPSAANVEWVLAFGRRVEELIRQHYPSLQARWRRRGYKYEAFFVPPSRSRIDSAPAGWRFLVIQSFAERIAPTGPSGLRTLPSSAPMVELTSSTFQEWVDWAVSEFGLRPHDYVVAIAIAVTDTAADKPVAHIARYEYGRFTEDGLACYELALRNAVANIASNLSKQREEDKTSTAQVLASLEGDSSKLAQHSNLQLFGDEPLNGDEIIWRYMSLTQFLSLLQRRALFLCRSDLLGDPYEGARGGRANAAANYRIFGHDDRPFPDTRRAMFVTCWHEAEYESVAMWSIYAPSFDGEGIAIGTTFEKLIESLVPFERFVGGRVTYLDYSRDYVPEDNLYAPYFTKRIAFQYEREIRLIHQETSSMAGMLHYESSSQPGIYLDCDLSLLISEIRIAPTSAPWFRDVVLGLMEAYDLTIALGQSDLSGVPNYGDS